MNVLINRFQYTNNIKENLFLVSIYSFFLCKVRISFSKSLIEFQCKTFPEITANNSLVNITVVKTEI